MDVWTYPGLVTCGKCGLGLKFEELAAPAGAKAIGSCPTETCERRGARVLVSPTKVECRVLAEKAPS